MNASNPSMSIWNQFWVLFRWQARWNFKLWRLPVFMSLLYFNDIMKYSLKVDSLWDTEISNLSIILLPGMLFLTSRGLFRRRATVPSSSPSAHGWTGEETEFLMARAIDRKIFHRAMTVLIYLLIMVVPVALLLLSFKNADLRVQVFRGPAEAYLNELPGSTLVPAKAGAIWPTIDLPNGNVLFAGWHVWVLFVAITGVQFFYLIGALDALKKKGWLQGPAIFARYSLIVLAKLILGVAGLCLMGNTHLFVAYTANQTAFWIFAVPLVILGQLCCECLFSRLEQ
jgi:hypothetical protein